MYTSSRSRRELGNAATFRPPRAAGIFTGSFLTLLALAAAIVAGATAARSDPEFRTALGWLAAGGLSGASILFASWTFCIATLAYRIEPGNLVVRWGLRRTLIALSSIESVVPGRTMDQLRVTGLNWWGCHVGSAEVRRIGPTLVFATEIEPERMVFVSTTDESYGLSIRGQAEFAEEIEAHRVQGPPPIHPQHSTATGVAALPIWRDRAAVASLSVSVLACVLVVGFVFGQYPSLAPVVEINFPGAADVVRVGNKQELLGIAYLAVAVLAVNASAGVLIHSRDRAAGLWLFGSTTLLQGALLAAAVFAFERA